jgi:hypothetical protein
MDKRPEDMTWAEVKATFAEAAALSKENEQGLKELRAAIAKTREDLSKSIAETREAEAERSREFDLKMDRMAKEREESLAELKKTVEATTKSVDKMSKSISGVNSEVKGIANSNGMVAEEYFFNTLDKLLTFGGYHFDFADRHLKRKRTDKDGKRVEAEYDVLMGNDIAACIMEVKYRARIKNIEELIEKVDKFRIHFPAYANHKILLAIGALSFEDGVEAAAKERGIGIVKQDGDAVVVYDKDLKIY